MKRYEAVNIPFYYCDIPNFGDALNPVIFEKLAGIKIRLAPVDYALIMGIGSLGENLLMDNIPPPPQGFTHRTVFDRHWLYGEPEKGSGSV